MLLLDAISLVDLNYTVLFSEMEEKMSEKEKSDFVKSFTSFSNSLFLNSANQSSDSSSIQLLGSGETRDQKKYIIHFLVNTLATRGIKVNTENEEEVILYSKKLFSSLFNDIKTKLGIWSEDRFRMSTVSTHIIIDSLCKKISKQVRTNNFLTKDLEVQKQMMRTTVRSEVAEKACNFVFEIERLKNILLKLVKAVDVQDVSIRENVTVLFYFALFLFINRFFLE
jgi:hypothetical protein